MTNLGTRDRDVGDLEAHPDRECQVSEIEVARGRAAGKVDAANAFGVLPVVQVRIPECERRVRKGPAEGDVHQAERDQRVSLDARDHLRAVDQRGSRQEARSRGEQHENVHGRAPGIFARGALASHRSAAADDRPPRQCKQARSASHPRPERSHPPGEPWTGQQRDRDGKCYRDAGPGERTRGTGGAHAIG